MNAELAWWIIRIHFSRQQIRCMDCQQSMDRTIYSQGHVTVSANTRFSLATVCQSFMVYDLELNWICFVGLLGQGMNQKPTTFLLILSMCTNRLATGGFIMLAILVSTVLGSGRYWKWTQLNLVSQIFVSGNLNRLYFVQWAQPTEYGEVSCNAWPNSLYGSGAVTPQHEPFVKCTLQR